MTLNKTPRVRINPEDGMDLIHHESCDVLVVQPDVVIEHPIEIIYPHVSSHSKPIQLEIQLGARSRIQVIEQQLEHARIHRKIALEESAELNHVFITRTDHAEQSLFE